MRRTRSDGCALALVVIIIAFVALMGTVAYLVSEQLR